MTIDNPRRDAVIKDLSLEAAQAFETLKKYDYYTGTGSQKKLQGILSDLEETYSVDLPRTEKSGLISSSAEDLDIIKDDEFVGAFLKYQQTNKLLDFTKYGEESVHSRYNVLMSTGRTSSTKPNLQNLPRDPRIRPIYKAAEGKCLVAIDYSALELATLAQICIHRYGESEMANKINDGADLHRYYASVLCTKTEEDITKEERQSAKAANFGFPGGLGIKSFVQYAKASYGVAMSEDEAAEMKDKWMEAFPEMHDYLNKSEDFENLKKLKGMDTFGTTTKWYDCEDEVKVILFKKIISGETRSKKGKRYDQKFIKWAFNTLKKNKFYYLDLFKDDIKKRKGSPELFNSFMRQFNVVLLPSGRVRGNCTFTQKSNTPFQGLASDGAKEAMWLLTKAGFKIINFIHDEFIIEMNIDKSLSKNVAKAEELMIVGMEKACPNVKIAVESEFMLSWNKAGTHQLVTDGEDIILKEIA
jgi:DNA polymerase I-like protein with 3'-5' exonuclease and polymerase domains